MFHLHQRDFSFAYSFYRLFPFFAFVHNFCLLCFVFSLLRAKKSLSNLEKYVRHQYLKENDTEQREEKQKSLKKYLKIRVLVDFFFAEQKLDADEKL